MLVGTAMCYLILLYAISLFELLTLFTCDSGFCRKPRLWHTRRAGEKCLLGLPLSKWLHGVERGTDEDKYVVPACGFG
jgi:hypothetical protein